MSQPLVLNRRNTRLLRRRKGMTALEVAIAIGAGLLFLAAAAFGIIRFLDNQRYNVMNRLAGSQAVALLGQIYGQQGTLAALTTANGVGILTGMGLKATTPWGGVWTVSTAGGASTVSLSFPLGGPQLATAGTTFASNMITQYPMVSCTFTSPNMICAYNVAQ